MRKKLATKKPSILDPSPETVVPAPPVGNPLLPTRPPELALAQASLQKMLDAVSGPHVTAGYGFGDLSKKDRTASWRLYVFSDDKALDLPKEHEGFPVDRRPAPYAGPAWGKAAKR
jgi:hypothetical protein